MGMSDLPTALFPTGTITFLFTDIEGSTKRWEHNSSAMQAAHSLQEIILRRAIDSHEGYAYKMIGDAFQAAFSTAPQALRAAVDAQRALNSEDWPPEIGEVKVRMALHTGITRGERRRLRGSRLESRGAYPLRRLRRADAPL